MSVDMAAAPCPEVLPPRKRRNADYEWDEFDPVDYLKRNYAVLREPDRRIITEVRRYFTAVAPVTRYARWLPGFDFRPHIIVDAGKK